jgi:hypothetical protein
MPDRARSFEPSREEDRANRKGDDFMIDAVRKRVSYSNVIATMSLFIALGGVAVAAGLPRHSVGPKQLKRGAVTTAALRKQAVTSGKLAPKSVINGKLGPNSVGPGNIGNGAVTTAKLAAGSVIASTIKNGVITTSKLSNEAVTTAKLANEAVTSAKLGKGSVTAAKLSDEIGPLIGALKTGQTLRGAFDVGGEAKVIREGMSFQFPLVNPPSAPEANVLAADASSAACPGLKGASQQTPEAAAGQLCVYVKSTGGTSPVLAFDPGSVSRLGFGLRASFGGADEANLVQGFWAVTAP